MSSHCEGKTEPILCQIQRYELVCILPFTKRVAVTKAILSLEKLGTLPSCYFSPLERPSDTWSTYNRTAQLACCSDEKRNHHQCVEAFYCRAMRPKHTSDKARKLKIRCRIDARVTHGAGAIVKNSIELHTAPTISCPVLLWHVLH